LEIVFSLGFSSTIDKELLLRAFDKKEGEVVKAADPDAAIRAAEKTEKCMLIVSKCQVSNLFV